MRINYTFFILLLIGFFNTAVAGSFEAVPPKTPKPKCIPERPIVYPGSYPYDVYQYPFFYVSAGIGAYRFRNPTVEVGNRTGTNAPITSINNNGVTPIYNVNLGYAFYNPYASIFGHFNDIMLKLSYLNTSSTKESNLGGTLGNIWYIDGGRRVGVILPIRQTSFTAKHRLIDAGLYYRSVPSTAGFDKVTFHPRIGVVFTNLNAKYNVVINYDYLGSQASDTEQYKVQTYYYGVAAGEQLAFHVAPQFLLLGDVELQLLYADSDLDASQVGISGVAASVANVSNHLNKITYRAIAYLGAKFYFLPKADSVSLDAKIGIDHWGCNPQVVTPNDDNGGRRIHLSGTSQNNPFVAFDVTVPIG
ncbi:MAG: hypothetical protein PVI75_07870 [Gammaproteobacteria bacterium]|jgi:hypothetical protein